tara:strand:- start:562 stop:1209 length:648 start_codon:yes stop_codon:yes gene_type:complete
VSDFYTPTGLHVYFKDQFFNDIDFEKVISKVESVIPAHLTSEVEMIIVGQIDDFENNNFNAMYKDGTIYVTNMQDDEEDMIDDIVHEFAHSVEEPYGMFIYGDSLVKKEFLNKRNILHDILWKSGFKAPKSLFQNVEYDKQLDDFLYKKVGYDKLSTLISGLFISTYAPTSLREYFATAFTDFYLLPNSQAYIQKVSPQLYKKLFELYSEETLDI